MNKAHTVFSHLTVILSVMFAVFLILDQFNPMMNFVDNDISRWLLAALCLSGVAQSILHWRECERREESAETAEAKAEGKAPRA